MEDCTLTEGELIERTDISSYQVYGASASCVLAQRNKLMGIEAGGQPVSTKETGIVNAAPELLAGVGPCSECGAGFSDEGAVFCLLIAGVGLAIFAIIWAVVMVVFSIVTLGGFMKRRYRTILEIQNENKPFLGKLAVLLIHEGGVLNYPLGVQDYDNWMSSTFSLFNKAKIHRQVSLLLASIWGFIEISFKLYQLVLNPSFSYDLWPFRLVMVLIFTPLILYSPFLEWRMRGAFKEGRLVAEGLCSTHPEYDPNAQMTFSEKPRIIEIEPVGTESIMIKEVTSEEKAPS